jgi:hypothetical protein
MRVHPTLFLLLLTACLFDGSTYAIDSTVFWGPLKNDGKDFTDRTHLPGYGAVSALVIGGNP